MESPPWYQDANRLRAALAEHGSIRRAAAHHGVAKSTVAEWAQRLSVQSPVGSQAEEPKWGDGRPQLVKPATRDAWERVVFLSDIHVPYQDHGVAAAALDFIRATEPHRVVLNGDLIDFFALSRFNKSGDREEELQADIDERNAYVRSIRDAAPKARLDETEGNHDNRIRSYLQTQAQSLRSLRALQPKAIFEHAETGTNWHPGCGFMLRPGFLVKHGNKVSSLPGGTARAEALGNLCSGISGHVHRDEKWEKTGGGGLIKWVVTGTMSRLDPDYVTGVPDWRQSIAYGEFSTKTSSFHVDIVPYHDGALRHGSARYQAKAAA